MGSKNIRDIMIQIYFSNINLSTFIICRNGLSTSFFFPLKELVGTVNHNTATRSLIEAPI